MRSLTWMPDNGMTIQFNQSFPFFCSNADLNTVGASFSEFKPAGADGVYTAGGTFELKAIVIPGQIVATSEADLEKRRNQLAMAFSVHNEGWLISHQWDGTKKKIRCRSAGTPVFTEKFGVGERFTISLRADRPYWLSYDDIVLPIGQTVPMMSWPWVAPVMFGYAVAELTVGNYSGTEIPTRIEVLSQATLIRLTRRCGTRVDALELATVIEEYQKLVIDGTSGDIYLHDILTGEDINASNRLVAGSKPITLLPGQNTIVLDNGIAGSTPLSYVIYNDHSLAV